MAQRRDVLYLNLSICYYYKIAFISKIFMKKKLKII